MWYLISSTNPDVKHVLLVGSEITVGRKDCTVLLTTDPTVSRKHASLQLAHAESNLGHAQKSALLTLKDLSKFGTWVNKKRVNGEVMLKDGDEITFGSPKSAFLIVCEPFIITTSCLDQVSKRSTKVIVRTFGGHIVSEWVKSCDLLVMNSISVTIKVICALITQKSIVLPGYLEKLLEYHKGNSDKPKPEDYQPTVSETQVNAEEVSFNPNPNRSSVFKGMKFIFLSQKQFKKMNLAVELAGGMPILMEEGSDDNDDRVLVEPGTVVMNVGQEEVKTLTQAGQEWVAHVGKYLKRKKKNFIQDAEIGYAVLFCSTEKHCNPDIDKAHQLFQHIPSQSLSQCAMEHSVPDVLVANTETSPGNTRRGTRSTADTKRVVDESVLEPEDTKIKQEVISQSSGTPVKRKRNDNPEEALSLESKRIKQEIVTPAKSHASSRLQTALKHDPEEVIPDNTDVLVKKQEQDDMSINKSRTSKKSGPKSRSPSPSPSRRSTRKQKSSPAREVIETSSDDADTKRTKGNRIRNVSPKPEDEFVIASKSSTPKRVPKGGSHAISDDDDDVTVTSISTNITIKSDTSENSSKKPTSPKPKKKKVFDDSDDEDIGLWQRNKRKRVKMEEDISKGDNSEDEMDIPSSKSRVPKEDSDGDDLFDVSPKRKPAPKRKVEERDIDSQSSPSPARSPSRKPAPRRKEVKEEKNKDSRRSLSPAKSPARAASRKNTQVKSEVIEDSEEEVMAEQSRVEEPSRRSNNQGAEHDDGEVPSGFLTTNIPIKKQEVKRSDFVKEEDKPTSVIVTKFVDLVAKRPSKNTNSSKSSGRKDIPEGYCEWKGKLVKNFKRFKKTSHTGSKYLPRIIGGSDLVVYTSNRGKEMGDWFNEATQNESQYARDREEQDLFDLDMPVGRTKRSR